MLPVLPPGLVAPLLVALPVALLVAPLVAVAPAPEITLFVLSQISNEFILQGKNARFHFIATTDVALQ